MYIILKDTKYAQEIVSKMARFDPSILVNKTAVNVIVKAPNVVGTIQIVDHQLKAWKAGEPNKPIFIEFKDLVSVLEL